LDIPDNQEAIQEMVARNPLFKKQKWKEPWLDRLHPERVVERNQRLAAERRILLERWQAEGQRQPAVHREGAVTFTIPYPRVESEEPARRPAFVERSLSQCIREVEEDERRGIETSTE
jgi:hypothetical protein